MTEVLAPTMVVYLDGEPSQEESEKSEAKLDVLPQTERELLLYSWNQKTEIPSAVCCLHELFEAQVECNGRAIAVECNGQTLSYSELNAQANQLANYLISKEVKLGDRIALCAERNMEVIIAILGIMKAGCAYVPLDPAYQSQRLTTILLDADPIFLLADVTGREALGDHQVPVIELQKPLASDLPIDNPVATELGLTPAHLAYIIYTSGSTGTPKGVMVEHRNATSCLLWIKESFTPNHFDQTSFSTSISFDMSLYECFAPLSLGGTICIVSNAIALSKSWNISMLSTVPSAVTTLLNSDSLPMSLPNLHLAGEPLKASLIRQIFEHTQVTELCNLYGQTETSFFSTMYRFQSGAEIIETIGQPIANTRMYLLNEHGEPVPLGAAGELYISGANVARGYLNRPELTAHRFLFDPFDIDPAARMFRTGDRAKYLADGSLVFLGRMDQQVKIRGFRIELGEIEARLVEHPQVLEAIVQSYGDGSDVRLVAYVIAASDKSLAENLRAYLLTLLPDYMVPVAYVCLESLPLTPNGKLDRRALPIPDDEAYVHQHFEAPQGEVEEKIARIWHELLGIGRISRHDNFFELGGHSLHVMIFVNKAKLHNMHIDARGVFSFPILKSLAEQITNNCSKRFYCCDAAIPVRQYGDEAPLFLLPDGNGDISYAFELAHDTDKNIPVYVLPWPSPESKQPSSIEEMARAMITLLKKVRPSGPCALAGYSGGGILAYEITKQLLNSGYPVSFLGLIDTFAPAESSSTETEIFLKNLRRQFPVFATITNAIWWTRVSCLTLNGAIKEIYNTNLDLSNIDIEWEPLLSKQRHNYRNMYAAFKIDSLPIKVHFFKAMDDTSMRKQNKKLFYEPQLDWKDYNNLTEFDIIPVDGDHQTIMTNPKNRSQLGNKMMEYLQLNTRKMK